MGTKHTHYCRFCQQPVNLTGDEVADLRQRYSDGATVTELANHYRISRTSVYRALESVRHPDEVGQGRLFDPPAIPPED